jgi:hypothetical protein
MPTLLVLPNREFQQPGQPATVAHAPNFERFDGLNPLDHPATSDPESGGTGFGVDYGYNELGHYPRPGMVATPVGQQTYTPGPLSATVGVLGGQPISLSTNERMHRDPGAQTRTPAPTLQFRGGVGQGYQGIGQTVALAQVTQNPPQPEDLTDIISGWA